MGGCELTLRDVCDIAHGVLRDRVERQALAAQQRHAVYMASGRYEIDGEEPTVAAALEAFEESLDAVPAVDDYDPRDRELFELMGVGRG